MRNSLKSDRSVPGTAGPDGARRLLLKGAAGALIVGGFASAPAWAQFRTSLKYVTYEPVMPMPVGMTPDRIEVIQFFYYGCPHCFDMEPSLQDWLQKKAADVVFRYQPAIRNDSWVPLTKAYYILEALMEQKRLHRPIYDNIHFDGALLTEEEGLMAWFDKNGFAKARVRELYHSPEIQKNVDLARKMTTDYKITATPTIVVAGKWAVSSGQAGSHFEALRLVDQFVGAARREKR